MRWRHLLLFLTIHFCFAQSLMAIKVTQVYFEGTKGYEINRRSEGSGYLWSPTDQRTFSCWDGEHSFFLNQEAGFWGLFSGHGPSNWYRDFRELYARRFMRSNFFEWLARNGYDNQIDPADLAQKVMLRFKGLSKQNTFQRLQRDIARIGEEFIHTSKHIKSSCSAAFLHLNSSTIKVGAIGSNAAVVCELEDSRSFLSPKYVISESLGAASKARAIGSEGFNVHDGNYLEIQLHKPERNFFVVFMNDAVRECVSDEAIVALFNVESSNPKDLAKRVTQKIIEHVKIQHKKMLDNWQGTAQEDDTLETPELGVGVIILNQPSKVNCIGADQKRAREIVSATRGVLIPELQRKYSKNNQHILTHDATYDYLTRTAIVRPSEKEKPSYWDTVFKWASNKYIMGTILTTALGYYAYLQFPSIKSFFSPFTKFFK